jgi:hypothetical protein
LCHAAASRSAADANQDEDDEEEEEDNAADMLVEAMMEELARPIWFDICELSPELGDIAADGAEALCCDPFPLTLLSPTSANGEIPTATRAQGAAIDWANEDDVLDDAADEEANEEEEDENRDDDDADDEGARCVWT